MEEVIALIPARAGSKRVPGKNIKPFFGHPLIAYAIAAALNSELFDRVLVSTDGEEIGRIARWYGAEHLRRPARLANDSAGIDEVALHAISETSAESLCLLMPNCPLRRASDINDQHALFMKEKRSFQISAIPYRGVYPQWALTMDAKGRGKWLFGEKFMVNSQKLGTPYCPTGAVWWARTADFKKQKTFYGKGFQLAPMDPDRGLDIDHPEDLALADVLTRGLQDRDGKSPLEPVAKEPYHE